jgi:hypothetical protein
MRSCDHDLFDFRGAGVQRSQHSTRLVGATFLLLVAVEMSHVSIAERLTTQILLRKCIPLYEGEFDPCFRAKTCSIKIIINKIII